MAHSNIQHRRTHNLLLISKLLSQRDAASPFTLVLDSLEQPARPLIKEYIRRANLAKTYVVFLGFETVISPAGTDHFIPCHDKTPMQIAQAVQATATLTEAKSRRHHLILIDTLHPLSTLSRQPPSSSLPGFDLTHFLSSLIAPKPTPSAPSTSLVAIYHTDIPLSHPNSATNQYTPTPLTLLTYLATTLLTTHSLSTQLLTLEAHSRSLAPPTSGLDAHKPGILIGTKPARFDRHLAPHLRGTVLELEHRRKSGRGVHEWYFLPAKPAGSKEGVTLLDDHALFRRDVAESDERGQLGGLTFELGLTERQRLERDGVVLPYFDAQREGGGAGPGEGGRILYDLGAEDDFDEEEDEI